MSVVHHTSSCIIQSEYIDRGKDPPALLSSALGIAFHLLLLLLRSTMLILPVVVVVVVVVALKRRFELGLLRYRATCGCSMLCGSQ